MMELLERSAPHELVKHLPQAPTRQHDQTLRAGPQFTDTKCHSISQCV